MIGVTGAEEPGGCLWARWDVPGVETYYVRWDPRTEHAAIYRRATGGRVTASGHPVRVSREHRRTGTAHLLWATVRNSTLHGETDSTVSGSYSDTLTIWGFR